MVKAQAWHTLDPSNASLAAYLRAETAVADLTALARTDDLVHIRRFRRWLHREIGRELSADLTNRREREPLATAAPR